MRFKLLGGRFHDRATGVTHIAKTDNEYVESDHDLVRIWGANKFQRMDYAPVAPRSENPVEKTTCVHIFGPDGSCRICGEAKGRKAAKDVKLAPKPKPKPVTKAKAAPAETAVADSVDVTDEFPVAVQLGFMVVQVAEGYNVSEADTLGPPLNAAPLPRDKVAAFIEEKA